MNIRFRRQGQFGDLCETMPEMEGRERNATEGCEKRINTIRTQINEYIEALTLEMECDF